MVIAKYFRSGSHHNLIGTLLVAFLSLVSVECITGQLSSSRTKTTAYGASNSTNLETLRGIKKAFENSVNEIVCFVDKECIMDCPLSPPENESDRTVYWHHKNERPRRGPKLSLTFTEVTDGSEEWYMCEIMSNGAQARHYFLLNVLKNETNILPIIVGRPISQFVPVDYPLVQLSCATLNTTTDDVTWLHEDKIIELSSSFIPIGGFLRIYNVNESLLGNYTCLVNSSRGTASSSAFLYTEEWWEDDEYDLDLLEVNNSTKPIKPFFVTTKKPNSTVIVKPATYRLRLKCPAAGIPRPNISWVKNGKPMNPAFGIIHYRNWSMEIDECISADSGNYTCIVCNELGCINSTYNVRIVDTDDTVRIIGRHHERPSIEEGHPENITEAVGGEASFTCPAINDIDTYVSTRWIKSTCNEIEHSYDDSRVLSYEEQYNIVPLTEKDEGWYSCVSKLDTFSGEICKDAFLKVNNVTR